MAAPKWQVNIAFETAIDSLTTQNKLIAGPDLYSYFLAHPTEIGGDGIHPNVTGAASIQRLWAEKMASLYTGQAIAGGSSGQARKRPARSFSVSLTKDKMKVQASRAGTLRIFSVDGSILKSLNVPAAGSYSLPAASGLCIARFASFDNNVETAPVVLH